jgi:hypothetical protein
MSENAAEIPDELLRRQDSPAVEPDSEPIVAHGDDLADGTTHGVGPGGTERDQSPYSRDAGDLPEVGIGGATSGTPHHPGYEIDPAVPPGARTSPSPEGGDEQG